MEGVHEGSGVGVVNTLPGRSGIMVRRGRGDGVDPMGGVMRSSDKSKSPKDRPQKNRFFKKQGKFWG